MQIHIRCISCNFGNYTLVYSYMLSHTCDAIVVACIDFRFQQYIRDWTNRYLVGKTFDLVGFAGSTKELGVVLEQIDISARLHHISQVVLIHHEECGAYGAESSPERHREDLQKAKNEILKS